MFTLEGAEPTAINAPLSSVGVNSLESDLNNTFLIKGEILTLSFAGKDEDNEEHIAVIVCKRAKPIEYIK